MQFQAVGALIYFGRKCSEVLMYIYDFDPLSDPLYDQLCTLFCVVVYMRSCRLSLVVSVVIIILNLYAVRYFRFMESSNHIS